MSVPRKISFSATASWFWRAPEGLPQHMRALGWRPLPPGTQPSPLPLRRCHRGRSWAARTTSGRGRWWAERGPGWGWGRTRGCGRPPPDWSWRRRRGCRWSTWACCTTCSCKSPRRCAEQRVGGRRSAVSKRGRWFRWSRGNTWNNGPIVKKHRNFLMIILYSPLSFSKVNVVAEMSNF